MKEQNIHISYIYILRLYSNKLTLLSYFLCMFQVGTISKGSDT